MNKYLQIAILIVVAVLAIFLLPKHHQEPPLSISNFEQCQQAGGTVDNTSDPAQCTAPNGQIFTQQQPSADEDTAQPDVVVDTPRPGDAITSPLHIKGRAKGNWFFEANLPVVLKDQSGQVLAQQGLHAIGNWMTTDYVEFDETISFTSPGPEYGTLTISKDNPSGDPQNDASFVVPLLFGQ